MSRCFFFSGRRAWRENGGGDDCVSVLSIVCRYGMSVYAECVYLCTRVSISDFSSSRINLLLISGLLFIKVMLSLRFHFRSTNLRFDPDRLEATEMGFYRCMIRIPGSDCVINFY